MVDKRPAEQAAALQQTMGQIDIVQIVAGHGDKEQSDRKYCNWSHDGTKRDCVGEAMRYCYDIDKILIRYRSGDQANLSICQSVIPVL